MAVTISPYFIEKVLMSAQISPELWYGNWTYIDDEMFALGNVIQNVLEHFGSVGYRGNIRVNKMTGEYTLLVANSYCSTQYIHFYGTFDNGLLRVYKVDNLDPSLTEDEVDPAAIMLLYECDWDTLFRY